MKVIAWFLLIVCIWDLINPFVIVNNARKQAGKTWTEIAKIKSFKKYVFSVFVNLVAILFFANFLFTSH